jgi:hypothetical protein
MTERQDLRPLSTEDLRSDHERTHPAHVDDQYRTDVTGQRDVDTDADRPVVSDQYDDVAADAEDRKYDGSGQKYDKRPAAPDEPVAEDEAVVSQDETVVSHGEHARQKPAENADGAVALFTADEVDQFRTEWRGLQSDFVDSPRDAVQHADQLVAQVMQSLATTFANHKKSLEGQWSQGEKVETEELRVALRQYRAFFDKLLTV